MEKGRFSLLLLEPNEFYFEDFSSLMLCGEGCDAYPGRLKLGSKSVLFEPQDYKLPIYKILLVHVTNIEEKNNMIYITSNQHTTLLKGNHIAPYIFHHQVKSFAFKLNYSSVDDCLPQILQLQRASSLPPPEQNSMIAAISYSRQRRLKFDPNYLHDMYERIKWNAEASKVTPLVVNPGRVVLTSERLYFQSFNNAESFPVLKIDLRQITEVKLRRFLQRHVGIEIFCSSGPVSHLYLSFKTEADRNQFYELILDTSTVKLPQLQPEIMTLKWQNHAISNFEYLMYLNSLADRSVNDLTQYPVFPWVIADYTSKHLDMNDPGTFRDLSQPMGALNPERLERLKQRRREMPAPGFLYGSHYSAPAFVLFYLIRKMPQLMLCMQNGRFDHPDRIFHSIADTWKNTLQNMSDFKELLPEFYDPSNGGDFLTNRLGLNLGVRHDGHSVHDVILPPWCEDPRDFVQKLRDALESSYVSENLPAWIDLIFGLNQRGENAERNFNVFYPICYEGAVDLDTISDCNERHALEIQIMEFGQIPKKIFNVPHPKKLNLLPAASLCSFDIEKLTEPKSRVICKHRDCVTALVCAGDLVFSVSRDSVLKEFSCSSGQTIRSVQIDSVGISSAVLFPGQYTIILGTFDNRIMVYDLEFNNVKDEVRAHEDAVTALCWSESKQLLLSGSWDGSLRIWPMTGGSNKTGRLMATPTIRFDHDDRVTCAGFSSTGDLATCGTDGGDVYVYTPTSISALFRFTHPVPVTAVTFASDGKRLISAGSEGFQIHDIMTGLMVFATLDPINVRCVSWMSDELLLLGCNDGAVQCWDLRQVEVRHSIATDKSAPVSAILCSVSNSYILRAQDSRVEILTW